MIPENARDLCYEEVRFQGKPALFTSLRVSLESIPEGMHRYEIRHDDEGGDPCQLARGILVNHFGTLLTAEAIPLPEGGRLDFEAADLSFGLYDCDTVEKFQQKYCNKTQ